MGIIRDTTEKWVIGYIKNLYEINSIKAELLALGIKLALENCLISLEINLDCKEAISFIFSNYPTYINIISDCRELLYRKWTPPPNSPSPIVHSFRKENQCRCVSQGGV